MRRYVTVQVQQFVRTESMNWVISSVHMNWNGEQFQFMWTELVNSSSSHELNCSDSSVHIFELVNYSGFGLVFSSWATVPNELNWSIVPFRWTELVNSTSSRELNCSTNLVHVNWNWSASSSSTSWDGTVTYLVPASVYWTLTKPTLTSPTASTPTTQIHWHKRPEIGHSDHTDASYTV